MYRACFSFIERVCKNVANAVAIRSFLFSIGGPCFANMPDTAATLQCLKHLRSETSRHRTDDKRAAAAVKHGLASKARSKEAAVYLKKRRIAA